MLAPHAPDCVHRTRVPCGPTPEQALESQRNFFNILLPQHCTEPLVFPDRPWLRKVRSWEKSILYYFKHALSGRFKYCSWVNTDHLLVRGWPITTQLSLGTQVPRCISARRHVRTPASRLLIGTAVSLWPVPVSFKNSSRPKRWMKRLNNSKIIVRRYTLCFRIAGCG